MAAHTPCTWCVGGLPHIGVALISVSRIGLVLADAMRQIALPREPREPREPCGRVSRVAYWPQKLARKLASWLATAQAALPVVLRARRAPQGGPGGLLR